MNQFESYLKLITNFHAVVDRVLGLLSCEKFVAPISIGDSLFTKAQLSNKLRGQLTFSLPGYCLTAVRVPGQVTVTLREKSGWFVVIK